MNSSSSVSNDFFAPAPSFRLFTLFSSISVLANLCFLCCSLLRLWGSLCCRSFCMPSFLSSRLDFSAMRSAFFLSEIKLSLLLRILSIAVIFSSITFNFSPSRSFRMSSAASLALSHSVDAVTTLLSNLTALSGLMPSSWTFFLEAVAKIMAFKTDLSCSVSIDCNTLFNDSTFKSNLEKLSA